MKPLTRTNVFVLLVLSQITTASAQPYDPVTAAFATGQVTVQKREKIRYKDFNVIRGEYISPALHGIQSLDVTAIYGGDTPSMRLIRYDYAIPTPDVLEEINALLLAKGFSSDFKAITQAELEHCTNRQITVATRNLTLRWRDVTWGVEKVNCGIGTKGPYFAIIQKNPRSTFWQTELGKKYAPLY